MHLSVIKSNFVEKKDEKRERDEQNIFLFLS